MTKIGEVNIGSRTVGIHGIDFEIVDGKCLVYFQGKRAGRLLTPEIEIDLEPVRRFAMSLLSAIGQHPTIRITVDGGTVSEVDGLYDGQDYDVIDNDIMETEEE